MQKWCLVNLASQPPALLYLSAEMAYRCNTHAASHHYFCSLRILLPLTETERAAMIGAQILPLDGQSGLSKRNEQHHFFVQEK